MRSIKLAFWSPCPNPHFGPLFAELFESATDIKVIYESANDSSRSTSGWRYTDLDRRYELVAISIEGALSQVPDWRERIHIIPGFGSALTRAAVTRLIRFQCRWVFLAEGPNRRNRFRYLAKKPLRRLFAFGINRWGLGALAIGAIADSEFRSWGVRREKIGFMPYTPDLGKTLQHQLRLDHFVYVGQMIPLKNVDLLLRAFSGLVVGTGEEPPTLHLIGDGPCRSEYEHLSNSLGLDGRVLFHGTVEYNRVVERLCQASVLVLPSKEDGWGAVLNEGAQAGLALIASSNCGAAYHLIQPGINGFRFESGDLHGLRRCLQAYVNQPELARQHGLESKRISEAFLPKPQARALVQQLQSWLALTDSTSVLGAGERDIP